jgi:hypothetical protein
VTEQGEQLRALHQTITELSEIETRNRQVAELAARVARATDGDDRGTEQRVGRAHTQDRDPGHYTRSSSRSFFGHLYLSRQGDAEAGQRLAEHNRALSTGVAGAGIVPPQWLADEFDALARQGRGLADAVRKIGLGDDPRPITLPRQTAGTDAVIVQQATENTPRRDGLVDLDHGRRHAQAVLRHPGGVPADARHELTRGRRADLRRHDRRVQLEDRGRGRVGTGHRRRYRRHDPGSDATNFTSTAAFDAVMDAASAVRDQRKLPADIVAMGVVRYGKFLKLKDTANRPLMPADMAGPMNVVGVGAVNVDGRFTSAGLGVIASDGLSTGGYPDSIVVFRAADTVLFEGTVQRFRFEEVTGPESVKLGIWAYAAVIVRQPGKSAKRVVVTAA